MNLIREENQQFYFFPFKTTQLERQYGTVAIAMRDRYFHRWSLESEFANNKRATMCTWFSTLGGGT